MRFSLLGQANQLLISAACVGSSKLLINVAVSFRATSTDQALFVCLQLIRIQFLRWFNFTHSIEQTLNNSFFAFFQGICLFESPRVVNLQVSHTAQNIILNLANSRKEELDRLAKKESSGAMIWRKCVISYRIEVEVKALEGNLRKRKSELSNSRKNLWFELSRVLVSLG